MPEGKEANNKEEIADRRHQRGRGTFHQEKLESIERQGEKLTAVMEGMQQNHGKQLKMMASFMGSLLEAIKDKK